MRKRARRTTKVLGAAVTVVSIALGGQLVSAHVVQAAEVVPVTDYVSYPSQLPPGCPDGAAALVGVSYEDGNGTSAPSLGGLRLANGQTLTMRWTGFAPGCAVEEGAQGGTSGGIDVSLAVYKAASAVYDHSADQRLVGSATCGPNAERCTMGADGSYSLTVTMPSAALSCVGQIDAILGAPLAVVGPSGSYYNSLLRGDDRPNMLISATGYDTEPCVAPTVTAAPPPPGPTSPVVAPPQVLPEPQATPVAVLSVGAPQAPTAVKGVSVVTAPTLAASGPRTAIGGSALGLTLLFSGLALVLASRRINLTASQATFDETAGR